MQSSAQKTKMNAKQKGGCSEIIEAEKSRCMHTREVDVRDKFRRVRQTVRRGADDAEIFYLGRWMLKREMVAREAQRKVDVKKEVDARY